MKYYHIAYMAKIEESTDRIWGDALFTIPDRCPLQKIRETLQKNIEQKHSKKFSVPVLLSVTPLSLEDFLALGDEQQ